MMLFDGIVIMNDVLKEFFSGNFFYIIFINWFIWKELLYVLIWEDVCEVCLNDMLYL